MFGLSGSELRFAFVISTAHLTQHLLMRLVPPLIPILAVALAYPLWQLGLLVSIYMVGGGVAQAPFGVLSDRYDRLYILPTGIVVGGGSYVLFAAAPSLGSPLPPLSVLGQTFEGGFLVMALAMLGVGVGVSVVHPAGYPLISANVGGENKGQVLGMFGSFAKLGDAIAPAVVGALLLVLVWEQIVLLLGLVAVAIGGALYLVLRSDEYATDPAQSGDDASAVTDEGSEPRRPRGAGDRPTTEPESSDRSYLYPLTVVYVFFVTKMFAGNGVNTFLPVFIVGVYAFSVETGAVALGPESVANFYFSLLLLAAAGSQLVLGGLTDRYDPRVVILGCLATATVGLLILALAPLSPVMLLLVVLVIGASLWGTNPARDALVSDIAPPDREGRTFGYIWTAVMLTGSIIPVLIGYTLETVGYREGFLILSIGTVLAGVSISLLFVDRIYERRPHPSERLDADPSD